LPLPPAVQRHDRIVGAAQSGDACDAEPSGAGDPAFEDWLESMMLQVAAEIEADLAAEAAAEAEAAGGPGDPQGQRAHDCPLARITEYEHEHGAG
jgi:hypothetical protein